MEGLHTQTHSQLNILTPSLVGLKVLCSPASQQEEVRQGVSKEGAAAGDAQGKLLQGQAAITQLAAGLSRGHVCHSSLTHPPPPNGGYILG